MKFMTHQCQLRHIKIILCAEQIFLDCAPRNKMAASLLECTANMMNGKIIGTFVKC